MITDEVRYRKYEEEIRMQEVEIVRLTARNCRLLDLDPAAAKIHILSEYSKYGIDDTLLDSIIAMEYGFNKRKHRLEFFHYKLLPVIKRVVDRNIRKPKQIYEKGQGNFTTDVDKELEEELVKELRELCPVVGFITEEGPSKEVDGLNWIIDPIDGTTNFINGLRFSTSIALQDKVSGEILIGMVYEHESGTVYYAGKDCGSYKLSNDRVETLRLSEYSCYNDIGLFGLPYDRSKADKAFELAKKFYTISSDLKRIGPTSLDICMVASGQAKFYFELDLHSWDMAAGLLILKEAGGNYLVKDDFSIFYVPSAAKEIKALLASD